MTNPIEPAETLASVAANAAAAAVNAVPLVSAGAAPFQPWPGELVQLERGPVFVRSTPVAIDAEPALFVHGLGGSALNWTDLMGLLAAPASNGSGRSRWA